jgi:hypothetical protein
MKEGNPNDRIYRFELSAEFYQFYLQDELVEIEVDWTEQEIRDNLALSSGPIVVGTICERIVPVEVQILASEATPNIRHPAKT